MGQIQTIDEFLSFLVRRRWLIALVFLMGLVLSIAIAKSRPDVYESVAAIQVETPTVEAGADAQRSDSAQVLQAIEHRLTTREHLQQVIDRHGLFTRLTGLTDDEKYVLLRRSVRFEGVASVANQTFGAPNAISAILITAQMDDPELAARVANDFAQAVLDMSNERQLASARETTAFYAEAAEEVQARIAALEATVADYRQQNASALPELAEGRRDELVSLDADLRSLGQQLLAAESQQAALSAIANPRATDKRQLDEVNRQISILMAQRDVLATRRDEVQAALAGGAEVERVLADHARALDQLRDELEAARGRLSQAEADQRLAERQQGERFTLLERAITPDYSLGSGGKKIAMVGALASLVLALGLAFGRELMQPVVRTADQMERQLDLRPVISIPDLGPTQAVPAGRLYRMIDDPNRPILGLPRLLIVAAGAALMIIFLAASMG